MYNIHFLSALHDRYNRTSLGLIFDLYVTERPAKLNPALSNDRVFIDYAHTTYRKRSGWELELSGKNTLHLYVFVLFWTVNQTQRSNNVHSVSSRKDFRLLKVQIELSSGKRSRNRWYTKGLKIARSCTILYMEHFVMLSWTNQAAILVVLQQTITQHERRF